MGLKQDWYPESPGMTGCRCPWGDGYRGCGGMCQGAYEEFLDDSANEDTWNQNRGRAYAGYLEGLTPYGIRNQQSLQNREMMRTLIGESSEKTAASGFNGYYQEDWEDGRDRERLKSLYPETAREIMPHVEEECDRMEYEGSMMFDEYPDKQMLSKISARILDKVKEKHEIVEGNDQDEALAMNVETRRRYPPGKNWLHDLIDVMLFEEVYRRRCRRRRCRRRW